MESVRADALDRQLVHALGLDGRASFSRIGEVLGVSDQTVARRYRRLRSRGTVRVIGSLDRRVVGGTRWWLRLQCVLGAGPAVATALAKRPDTSWVQLLSGGTEVLCAADPRSDQERDVLMLDRLQRTDRVVAVSAYSLLHMFAGGPTGCGMFEVLTEEQIAALRPPSPPSSPPPLPSPSPSPSPLPSSASASASAPFARGRVELSDRDRLLLAGLSVDGRTSHADLAAATGWSESTVRRRLDQLRECGALYYDLEVDCPYFGLHTVAWLWMAVSPSHLAAVGEALATHPEVTFAAATTGPTNLAVNVLCRDDEALYSYLSGRIAGLPGIQKLETAPIIRNVKQSGAFLPV
ncbi:Lrp/AsnC family transcriptional regulator [Streptosporangium sp. DT93]|uniref:Lrp/AsnC family transcriptional regulator n=1 Tax=Streptosporangium sp. DT93 TaxID=3393428 RepID=UPI003CEEE894